MTLSAPLAGPLPDGEPQLDRLVAILRDMGSVLVCYSGGVDSAFVLAVAHKVLGDKCIGMTAVSPSLAEFERDEAIAIAKDIGARHELVPSNEIESEDYAKNHVDRCFHCKSELYRVSDRYQKEWGLAFSVNGTNLDDLGDYRPGLAAAAEHAVRHPLQEAGFTKADVRAVAKDWGLPTWDKPASPCLSSRLAPGLAVTPERTRRVEEAEAFLRANGLRDCRVRYHEGDLARVELPLSEVAKFAAEPLRGELAREFRRLGFAFVTLDLEGFRSGSLNELVPLEVRTRFEPPRSAPRRG